MELTLGRDNSLMWRWLLYWALCLLLCIPREDNQRDILSKTASRFLARQCYLRKTGSMDYLGNRSTQMVFPPLGFDYLVFTYGPGSFHGWGFWEYFPLPHSYVRRCEWWRWLVLGYVEPSYILSELWPNLIYNYYGFLYDFFWGFVGKFFWII